MRVQERLLLICVCFLVVVNCVLLSCMFRKDNKEDLVKICLPPRIYALKDHELNIYFDNIINGKDLAYDYNVICDIGNLYEGFYRVIPKSGGYFL